ncbi:MAG: type 2 isopentenyl-diphosphate Delta-isomerase [Saprospiraceae bacterium]|nr:type 2 isopentenyl-diphosphate Delta-isomerase [Saprospiraceae bacterium]
MEEKGSKIEIQDPTSEERKKDHIELAFKSQTQADDIDHRFYYEPMLSGHPGEDAIPSTALLGHTFKIPVWVSSMTGGTALARTINFNLARACKQFGMGMGLGSCRSLLYSNETLTDFDVRHLIGDQPLYANLGIAQVAELVAKGAYLKIKELVDKLSADGLIIHVNPLQEWLQPEGDSYMESPLDVIKKVLDHLNKPIIVKEVGQGMGPESIKALMKLPVQAIDFAAHGGTNFSKLELLRSDESRAEALGPLVRVGHSAGDMVQMVNQGVKELGNERQCHEIIVSGGIRNYLDGYYCLDSLSLPAVYGQASAFLKHAREGYEPLEKYIEGQISGLKMAYAFLKARKPQQP